MLILCVRIVPWELSIVLGSFDVFCACFAKCASGPMIPNYHARTTRFHNPSGFVIDTHIHIHAPHIQDIHSIRT